MPAPSQPDDGERPRKTADIAAYRKAYRAAYRSSHRRSTLTLTREEFEAFARFAQNAGYSVPEAIRTLATDRLAEIPPEAPENTRRVEEAVFLLRNLANNINQIARRLNIEARESGMKVVRDEPSSRDLLLEIFTLLQGMAKSLPGTRPDA